MRRLAVHLFLLFAVFAVPVRAAHTEVQLILSATTARPGDTVLAGVQLKMEPGWHTYWKNPGEAGQATEIKWQLPPGVTAGEIQWPLPAKLPPAEVTTYGYEDEVVLMVPLTLASNLPAGPLNLSAKVSWLECKESCIPANAEVQATFNVGSNMINSAGAALIASWQKKLPKPSPSAKENPWKKGWAILSNAWWEQSENSDTRSLIVEWTAPDAYVKVDFFADASDNFEILPATQAVFSENARATSAGPGKIYFRVFVKKYSGDWPTAISGTIILLQDGIDGEDGFDAKFYIGKAKPSPLDNLHELSNQTLFKTNNNALIVKAVYSTSNPPTSTLSSQLLWHMLLFAFIGGLILNIMPCVLPVIALKILGFVGEAKSEPRRVRKLGLTYALGVLISFLILAMLVIGVKAAGHHAGWGMQFGSPVFIVCLTTLVTLVALNLFGIFEVTLGGRALDTAGELASKPGAAGAFFNGVLATVLATPCTAPFLGAALGFAFAQSASVIVLIFLTVGLGLASPYILLSWNPAWLKFLPKPGAWMENFKVAMGFPMLATVVWLFNVAASSYGKNVLWLGIFLVVIAFAAWIFGEFFQRGRQRRGLALAMTFILLAGGYAFALEKELDWRTAMPEATATGSLKESANGIDWQPWSAEAVAQARAAGKPVLVDFTADWCLTCQVNKKTSIEISSVREKLKALNAVALLGDYTHFPDAITTELNRYNRAGVPLVLVYPKNAEAQPLVLPEVLTPGMVLDALERAAK